MEALPFLVRFKKKSEGFYYVKINEERQVWVNRVTFSVLGLLLFSSGSQEHQRGPPARRLVSFQHPAWSWPDRFCSDNQPPGGIPPERQNSFEPLQKLTRRYFSMNVNFTTMLVCLIVSVVCDKMSHLLCTTNNLNVWSLNQHFRNVELRFCWFFNFI